MLVAVLVPSGCGDDVQAGARVLSKADCLTLANQGCVAEDQVAVPTVSGTAAPVVSLRRAAEVAESIQWDFSKGRAPVRFAVAHRESLRLGMEQLQLIRKVLVLLQSGAPPEDITGSEVRDRGLLAGSDGIAGELGLRDCVNGRPGS